MMKTRLITAFTFFIAIMAFAATGYAIAPNQRSFFSPAGKYEILITAVDHMRFSPEEMKSDFNRVSRVVYRMDFSKMPSKETVKSIYWNDVYGALGDPNPAPVETVFFMLRWSPKEQIAILPEEGWASAPGTQLLKALALDNSLAWREADFEFDRFFWLDDLKGVGDRKSDCEFGVYTFDGRTGQTIPLKNPSSPTGYELVDVRGTQAIIRQISDNCGKSPLPPTCAMIDTTTGIETPTACPGP